MNAILISSIWGVLILIISLWQKNRKAIFLISLIGLIILWIANYYQFNGSNLINWSSDFIQTSNASLFYMLLIIGFSILYFMLNKSAFEEIPKFTNEIYVLLFFTLTGSCILAFFDNLLMLFLGLEILSLPLYILTGIDERNVLGIEASLKYFLMGAFF
ncbi:MAG: proton-conducting transporter membrane subunit, partial [Sediminibacterium sp.]|nr:proton-conducting transporter membrane subunit [Sediminibacterium sp.]